jgi:integrase
MGHNPFIPSITATSNTITFGLIVDNYLASLNARGAVCGRSMARILGSAKESIGEAVPASQVSPEAVCKWLGVIWGRGSEAMADRARAYLSAAFNHSMQYDYRNPSNHHGIKENPVSLIQSTNASSHVRNRIASKQELSSFISRIESDLEHPAARALLISLLVGCRIEEAANLTVKSFNISEKSLYWDKTKTGVSHKIGIGNKVAGLLRLWSAEKSDDDYIFPSQTNPRRAVSADTILKYFGRMRFVSATPRDFCRRSFASWAQAAGLTREMIDLIQCHQVRSIATRHYDRYKFTEDGIQAISKALNAWENWIECII